MIKFEPYGFIMPNFDQTEKTFRQAGFFSLEILLAMCLLVFIFFGAGLILSGGNIGQGSAAAIAGTRSLWVDGSVNSEALLLAQAGLEKAQAQARKSFFEISSEINYSDGFYTNQQTVIDVSPCVKKIIEKTTWNKSIGIQSSRLVTLITNPEEAKKLGGDCCTDFFNPNDWSYPTSVGEIQINNAQGTDIDIINKLVHLTALTNDPAENDFYIVWPPYNSAIPNYVGIDLNRGEGANAVDVAYYSNLGANGEYYAFVAVNFNSIDYDPDFANDPDKSSYTFKKQLQVINVTDYKNLDDSNIVAAEYLPNVQGQCNATCPGGRSIYYYKEKVYLGTHAFPYLAQNRHEFYIYDVSNPVNPVLVGSKKITHNINKIVVQDRIIQGIKKTYAFLATSDDTGELHIYDVTEPENIQFVNSFDARTFSDGFSDRDAISLYLLGNIAYLGRKGNSNSDHPNFYILDISDLNNINISGVPKYISGQGSNANIYDIFINSGLAFISVDNPNDKFQIWDISNPSNMIKISDISCFPQGFLPDIITAIDLDNNRVYAAIRSDDIIKIFQWGNIPCI